MKIAKLSGSLLLAALLPLAGCDKAPEPEAEGGEKKEEIPNVQIGLPPPPNFDDARAPVKLDTSYSPVSWANMMP